MIELWEARAAALQKRIDGLKAKERAGHKISYQLTINEGRLQERQDALRELRTLTGATEISEGSS